MKEVTHNFFCIMLAVTLLNSPVLITNLVWHLDIKYTNILRIENDIIK